MTRAVLFDFGGTLYRLHSNSVPPPVVATHTPTATPLPLSTPVPTVAPPTVAPPTAAPTIAVDADFVLPGTQPGQLVDPIVDPATCSACHTEPIYKA